MKAPNSSTVVNNNENKAHGEGELKKKKEIKGHNILRLRCVANGIEHSAIQHSAIQQYKAKRRVFRAFLIEAFGFEFLMSYGSLLRSKIADLKRWVVIAYQRIQKHFDGVFFPIQESVFLKKN